LSIIVYQFRRYFAMRVGSRMIGYISAVNEPTGSGSRYLSDKIMTMYVSDY